MDKLIILNAPHPVAWRKFLANSWDQLLKSFYIFIFQWRYLPELILRSYDLKIFDSQLKYLCTEEEIEAYKYTYSKFDSFNRPLNYYRGLFMAPSKSKNKTFEKPVLVLWGTNDTYLTLPLADASKQYAPDCRVKLIENCSHWTQVDKPVVVNKYIRDFVENKMS